MLFKVNGRTRYFDNLNGLEKVSPSTYIVYRHEVKYRIEGGKHAGGTKNEWFVDTAEWSNPIFCTSLMDALNLLEKM